MRAVEEVKGGDNREELEGFSKYFLMPVQTTGIQIFLKADGAGNTEFWSGISLYVEKAFWLRIQSRSAFTDCTVVKANLYSSFGHKQIELNGTNTPVSQESQS